MQNPIKDIIKFNKECGLLDKGYSDFLESSFQIEEALEGFEDDNGDIFLENFRGSPKEVSREILRINPQDKDIAIISDVDRLDKACDAIVYAIGSMAKLGLDYHQVTQALNIVMAANWKKKECGKDEHGKLLKPLDWAKYAPEPKLQELLDRRK